MANEVKRFPPVSIPPSQGCKVAVDGEGECALNADDRAVVDAIKRDVEKIAVIVDKDEKVNRALSTSLIGRSNGDIVDEGGGRIGRLERLVAWAISGVVGILIWLLAQFVSRMMK